MSKPRRHNPHNCPCCIFVEMPFPYGLTVGDVIRQHGMYGDYLVTISAIYTATPGKTNTIFAVHGSKAPIESEATHAPAP